MNAEPARRGTVVVVRPVPDPLPRVRPALLGLPETVDGVTVLLRSRAAEELATLPRSSRVEEGGFLVGRPMSVADRQVTLGEPQPYLVEVHEIVPAQHTKATATRLTFTPDTFAALNERLAGAAPARRLLGWYHTHLGVGPEPALSSVDVAMHTATFRVPWQVAAVVNLYDERRAVRFFARSATGLDACAHWIVDDLGRCHQEAG
ncbi:hypothetical protein ACFV7R_29565 [Streptomyces sp. NPDC059866]|uniref:hypothetical protein n=1 Tax=Streptomyces sp. NPDC059866 TaxID=3346978 RepID=UPI003647937A